MGNPHAVIFTDNLEKLNWRELGAKIEAASAFPQGTNVEFILIDNRGEITVKVWERGAGETLACGTGACAAVVAGIRRGLLESPVRVSTRGGDLLVAWNGPDQPVAMTGPAVAVFAGEIEI